MKKTSPCRLIYASSTESSDIIYATNFNAPDIFAYFETPDGKKHAMLGATEIMRAKMQMKKDVDVIDWGDMIREMYNTSPQGKRDLMTTVSRHFGVTSWIVPERFPLVIADRMRANGIEVTGVLGDYYPERAVKTAEEIEKIREAMRVTQRAMELVHDTLSDAKTGKDDKLVYKGEVLTCEALRSMVNGFLKREGFTATGTIIACGPRSAAPHFEGEGPVYAHQVIVSDIFPRSDSTLYWGDMTRTFVKGEAPEEIRKAFDAVKRASEESLKVLKEGVTGAFVHNVAAETLRNAGYLTGNDFNGNPCGFTHALGHGVGLDIHEAPRLSPIYTSELKAGSVVSVEPGLYYPKWGGVRLEDLVVVTKDSYENFCTMPKELEIE